MEITAGHVNAARDITAFFVNQVGDLIKLITKCLNDNNEPVNADPGITKLFVNQVDGNLFK